MFRNHAGCKVEFNFNHPSVVLTADVFQYFYEDRNRVALGGSRAK